MAHNPTTDPHNLEGRITFDRGHNPDPPASDCDAGEALDQNNVLIEVLHEVDLFEEDSKEVESHFFQRVERQLKMLRGLTHVNVAEFQGWMVMLEDESWLRAKAVHARCEGGKIMAYLSINANVDRRDLVLGVSRGLLYLHSKGIVHGNLNPSNVHIDYDVQRRPVPRISGFESSYTITDDDPVNLKMEGPCSAPLRYIAPEVMAQLGFLCGQKGDIWSFGCTSSQMLLGKRPYEGIQNDYHIPSVVARHVDPFVWDSADPFHEVLHSCLVHDPSRRTTSSDIVERLESAIAPPKYKPKLLEVNERRRGFVMTEDIFHAMASSTQPPSIAISDVHQALNDESVFLRDGEVTDVFCYHRNGMGGHDYLILSIRLGSGSFVWARAERVPSTQERGIIGIILKGSAACDNITFSYHAPAIRGPEDSPIMMLRCNNVKLVHSTQLFSIIHDHSPEYRASSFNCWWFAAVSIGVLRHLDQKNDWIKFPGKDWINSAVKIVRSTKEVTKNVTHEFLSPFNVRKDVDLSNEATWGYSRAPSLRTWPSSVLMEPSSVLREASSLPMPSSSGKYSRDPPLPTWPRSVSTRSSPVSMESSSLLTGPSLLSNRASSSSTELSSLSTGLSSLSVEPYSGHVSVYSPPVSVPGGLGISSLVRDVVATHNIEDYKILIVGHRSAISSGELLRSLKTIWRDPSGDDQVQLKDGVLKFLQTWVSLGFLDVSFTSEVLRIVDEYSGSPSFGNRREIEQIRNALERPTTLPPVKQQTPTIASGSSVGSTSSGKQRKIKGDTFDRIDLLGLAKALFEEEMENMENLTMPHAVRSLIDWQNHPEALDSMPFSPLVGQIQDWVNEECLNKRYDARRKAFQSFYLLACECEKLGNLASSQAIARALCGGYIRKFNFIRARAEKSAGGSEGLREALQRLSEPLDTVPAIIPPLDYRLRRLLPVFRDIRDNAATINWEACKLFYQNLKLVFQQLVPASPEANVPESYHRFLHDRMYQASLNRSNHQNLSELLFADEARELHQMRAGAGFGF